MKKKWIESLEHADDRFIEEADPTKMVKKKTSARRVWMTLTACACLAALFVGSFGVYHHFFGKDGEIARYRDSEYYNVIVKLDALKKKYTESTKDNMTNGGTDMAPGMPEGDMDIPSLPPTDDGMNGDVNTSYEEITDNQVAGVTEGDRIKRSNRHVYYLHDHYLYVYSIEGQDSELVSKFAFSSHYSEGGQYNLNAFELYLSEDCKTVTVMMPYYSFNNGMDRVDVCQLDVTDPANIKWKNTVTIDGSYHSSRVVDGDYLVLTHYSLYMNNIDFDKVESFIPRIDGVDGASLIAPDHIIMPEALTDTSYTVVARLDGKTMQTQGTAAFLSYANDVYVGTENIFATHSVSDTVKDGNLVTTRAYTDVARLGYGKDAFAPKGNVKVEGTVKDRYSLDEYKGILRVVTTTSVTQYREITVGDYASSSNWHSSTNAALYCVDVETMEVKSSVKNFAPEGESVQSARYEGDKAYVCTAIVFSDPVFFFDLSDPMNITYKETDPIDGFSSSLVNFNNGMLLGIGRTDWSTLKVEVYREGTENVESVCKFELQNVSYSTDYKSYYIDRENQIVGIPIVDYNKNESYYLVLHFNGAKLTQVVYEPIGNSSTYLYARGFFADEYFYIFGDDDFAVKELKLG